MIIKRLKHFIDHKNISISAFEKSIGMSNASFRKSLQNNTAIGTDKLEKILNNYTEINPEWLLTGEGPMIKNGQSTHNEITNNKKTTYLTENQSSLLEYELLKYLKEKDKRLEALIHENASLKIKIEQLKNQI